MGASVSADLGEGWGPTTAHLPKTAEYAVSLLKGILPLTAPKVSGGELVSVIQSLRMSAIAPTSQPPTVEQATAYQAKVAEELRYWQDEETKHGQEVQAVVDELYCWPCPQTWHCTEARWL